MSEFINEPIPNDELPGLNDDAFLPIDGNFLRVRLLGIAAFVAVVVVGGTGLSIWTDDRLWLAIMAGLFVLTAIYAVVSVLAQQHMAYQIREHDVSYRKGVLIQTVSTIPFVRVQHARIRRGPVERRFGIATLDVNSAGPDLVMHGLSDAVAERLKVLIVERAGDLTEED